MIKYTTPTGIISMLNETIKIMKEYLMIEKPVVILYKNTMSKIEHTYYGTQLLVTQNNTNSADRT